MVGMPWCIFVGGNPASCAAIWSFATEAGRICTLIHKGREMQFTRLNGSQRILGEETPGLEVRMAVWAYWTCSWITRKVLIQSQVMLEEC